MTTYTCSDVFNFSHDEEDNQRVKSPVFFHTQASQFESAEFDSLPPSPSLLAEASQPFVLQSETAEGSLQNHARASASQSTQSDITERFDINDIDIECSSTELKKKEESLSPSIDVSEHTSTDSQQPMLTKLQSLHKICMEMKNASEIEEENRNKLSQYRKDFVGKAKQIIASAIAQENPNDDSEGNFNALSQLSQDIHSFADDIDKKEKQMKLKSSRFLIQGSSDMHQVPIFMSEYSCQAEENDNDALDINLEAMLASWEGNVKIKQKNPVEVCTFTARQVSQMLSEPEVFTVMAQSSLMSN